MAKDNLRKHNCAFYNKLTKHGRIILDISNQQRSENFPHFPAEEHSMVESIHQCPCMGDNHCTILSQLGILHIIDMPPNIHVRCSTLQPIKCKFIRRLLVQLSWISETTAKGAGVPHNTLITQMDSLTKSIAFITNRHGKS